MKAIRIREFGGPEVLKLEEIDVQQPGAGQVLVRIKAVGVNPVEAYIRSGLYPRKPELPYTPGSDAGGTIEAVGSGVTGFKVNDRVYTYGSLTGTYGELALCNESQVYPLPNNVTFEQGAALGVPYGTAYRALFQRAHATSGESVLIHGATGGVGIAAIQLAMAAGIKVFATGGTEKGRALIAEQGVRYVFDHRAPDYLDKVMSLTAGAGVEVILEMLANANLGKDLQILALKGRVVVIGSRGPVEINPREMMSRDSAILGMTLFNTSAAEMRSIHAALIAGLCNGTLKPVIGKKIPLKDAKEAHQLIMEPGACGKIVLMP
jgi:NADPH2:quinone reductase